MDLLYKIAQGINIPGIIYTPWVSLIDHRKMIPNLRVKDINDISIDNLKERGIEGIIFDKDNTLTVPYGYEIHSKIISKFEEFKVAYEDKIAIISNSAGILYDKLKGYPKAKKIEEAFGIPVIKHDKKKPLGIESVLEHFGIDDPSKLAIVGDRIWTDIAFGNRYNMYTILVDPFTLKGDHLTAIACRFFERPISLVYEKVYGVQEHKLK